MVKSETRRDAEILVRNPSPRLFGKKFRDSKKVNTNHAKTRLRDLSKTLPRFRDPAKIFRDPRFSRYHSPPLNMISNFQTSRFCLSNFIRTFIHKGCFIPDRIVCWCRFDDIFLVLLIRPVGFIVWCFETLHAMHCIESTIIPFF